MLRSSRKTDADPIRELLRPLLLPGQRKLHWSDESGRRRREIVGVVAGLEAMQVIITHRSTPSRKTERYRRKCLEQLYFELGQMEVTDLTLESRQQTQNAMDLEHIRILQGLGQAAGIRLRHSPGMDDPLLWIPDMILGALNTSHLGDSRYWEALLDQVVLQKQTPDSL